MARASRTPKVNRITNKATGQRPPNPDAARPNVGRRSAQAMEITRAAFVEAYFSNGFNASAAATEIGIAGTPNVAGYRMLSEPEVKRAIGERARRLSELSEMTSVNWARELSCIAFSRIGDVYDPDTGVLLPPHLLPPHVQSAVSSFDGERYRFHDKNAALTTIGKHLGLFERDNAQLRPDIKVRIELVG